MNESALEQPFNNYYFGLRLKYCTILWFSHYARLKRASYAIGCYVHALWYGLSTTEKRWLRRKTAARHLKVQVLPTVIWVERAILRYHHHYGEKAPRVFRRENPGPSWWSPRRTYRYATMWCASRISPTLIGCLVVQDQNVLHSGHTTPHRIYEYIGIYTVSE